MSDLAAAAAALGIPEALVQRSAEARAQETGATVDEVLAAWAGGGPGPVSAQPAEPADTETEPPTPEETSAPKPEVTIEIPAKAPTPGTGAAPATTRAAVPAQVSMAEAANLPVVVTVPTTGIKERTNFTVPKWLATIFILMPLVALFALGGAATGECGSSTELKADVITGAVVNCDGSKFEGSSIGGGSTDFVALGESIFNGQAVTAVNCSSCHGAGGGGGVGPALNGVLTTFGACADHEEWVGLGSAGFKSAGRNSYGDTNKTVTQGMPGFAGTLSPEQLASVVAFERARFGGADPATVLTDCGLAEEAPPEGAPAEGETPGEDGAAPGDEGATTSTSPEASSPSSAL